MGSTTRGSHCQAERRARHADSQESTGHCCDKKRSSAGEAFQKSEIWIIWNGAAFNRYLDFSEHSYAGSCDDSIDPIQKRTDRFESDGHPSVRTATSFVFEQDRPLDSHHKQGTDTVNVDAGNASASSDERSHEWKFGARRQMGSFR